MTNLPFCRFFRFLILPILAVLSGLVSPGSGVFAEESEQGLDFDDWVPDPNKTYWCGGYYRQPIFQEVPEIKSSNQPMVITGDRGEFVLEGTSIFEGHVKVVRGNRFLEAKRVDIFHSPHAGKKIGAIEAKGAVRIIEPDIRLEGTRGYLDLENDTCSLESVGFRLYRKHARGTASRLVTFGNDCLELWDVTYTTCAPGEDVWLLHADKVKFNRALGRGSAQNAWLTLRKVPVFYFPYVSFPIDDRRETGFLYPSYASSSQSGLEIAAPFYWNIAPNYDLTMTPRFLSKRGIELHNHFRFLQRHQEGTLQFAFLPSDRAYRAFRQNNLAYHPEFPNNDPRVKALEKSTNNRYYLGVKDKLDCFPHWTGDLEYQSVSDDNYFMDFNRYFYGVDTNYLLQRTGLRYADRHWEWSAQVQQYKVLHPFTGPDTHDPYRQLPQTHLGYSNVSLPHHFVTTMDLDVTRFTHEPHLITGDAYTTGERYVFRPHLGWHYLHPAGFFKPSLRYHLVHYRLTLSHSDEALNQPARPNLTVPIWELDTGLQFERRQRICRKAYIQTLEPRLYYLDVPFRDQNDLPNFDSGIIPFDYNQLYRNNRFTGYDRIGDTRQVTLGLTSRLITQADGTERLQLGVGQILYLKSRRVSACQAKSDPNCLYQELPDANKRRSSVAGQAVYRWDLIWSAQADLEWNPYLKKPDRWGLALQYRPDEWNVINLGGGYIRRNPAIIDKLTGRPEQVLFSDTSIAWYVTERMRVLGRWYYDWEHKQSNQFLLGIEQQGCCLGFRFTVARTLLPYDVQRVGRYYTNRFAIQLVFKGLAGIGSTQMNRVLKQEIPGYEPRGDVF